MSHFAKFSRSFLTWPKDCAESSTGRCETAPIISEAILNLTLLKKCTPKELSVLLPAFHKIATSFHPFESPSEVGFTSTILNDIIFSLPKLKSDIQGLVDSVLLKQAAEGKKDTMWADADKYPAIADIDLVCSCALFVREDLKLLPPAT